MKSFKKLISKILIIILILYNFLVNAITPFDITGKVFYFDAQDINGNGIFTDNPSSGTKIDLWIDKFNNNTGFQFDLNKQPILFSGIINGYPGVGFDGINTLLEVKDNLNINLNTGYNQKSFVLLFKTSDDINTLQTIYEQGGKEKGFAFQIKNGNLYVGTWNTIDWVDKYKIFNLGSLTANTVYSLIFTFDANANIAKAYLNKNLISSLSNISTQTTHGACSFDTSFGCNIYQTGGSIGIGATQNDSLDLSNSTGITIYQGNFFKGWIGELIQYNYALNDIEINSLFDYLFVKWGIDLTPPTITGSNFISGSILPGKTHIIDFYYSDNHTGSLGIDTGSYQIALFKRDASVGNWGNTNIASTGLTLISISTGKVSFQTNLSYGKYLIAFRIADNAGNYSSWFGYTFYIDQPSFLISNGNINLGTLNTGNITISPNINITVNTIGVPFKIIVKKQTDLTYLGNTIPDYNGSVGYGIISGSNLTAFPTTGYTLISEPKNLNTDGNLNTYNYTFNLGAIINDLQAAGYYTGYLQIEVLFSY